MGIECHGCCCCDDVELSCSFHDLVSCMRDSCSSCKSFCGEAKQEACQPLQDKCSEVECPELDCRSCLLAPFRGVGALLPCLWNVFLCIAHVKEFLLGLLLLSLLAGLLSLPTPMQVLEQVRNLTSENAAPLG